MLICIERYFFKLVRSELQPSFQAASAGFPQEWESLVEEYLEASSFRSRREARAAARVACVRLRHGRSRADEPLLGEYAIPLHPSLNHVVLSERLAIDAPRMMPPYLRASRLVHQALFDLLLNDRTFELAHSRKRGTRMT